MHAGSRTSPPIPKARADRATAPRFSGSLRPSSTASVAAPAATSASAGQRSAVGGGDGAAVEVEPDGRGEDVARRDVDRRVDGVEGAVEAGQRLRGHEHRPDPVARRQQPADRRDALGDEQLVALEAAAGAGSGRAT